LETVVSGTRIRWISVVCRALGWCEAGVQACKEKPAVHYDLSSSR
jgi:hypothetical protein